MYLTRNEEKSLNGENGEAIASAYKILLAIGIATEAERLVPIKWAHISGVNYNTIGDAGVEFLERFSKDAKAAVKTTLNPMGFDIDKPASLPENFAKQQMRIVSSYEKMGTTPSFTCIPYEIFDIPDRGSVVSFAESNAALYSNSVLGLMTNKESSLSALASSVTGKAPYSDLRIEEFRHPKVTVKPAVKLMTEIDYGLLGYFAGKMTNDSCIALDDIKEKANIINIKSLSAAIGTSGTCGMFTSEENTNEVILYGREESNTIKEELNTAEDGNIIVLGSPQLGINELNFLSALVESKKFLKRCMIFCPRVVYNQAANTGLIDKLQKSGVEFMCDSCTCLTPLITRHDFDSVITNSIKGAYYLNHSNRVGVALKDMKSIVKEYAD
jgi:predicted aconitase